MTEALVENLHPVSRRHPAADTSGSRRTPPTSSGMGAHGQCAPDREDFSFLLVFVQKVGELAEAEGHHPDVTFGWGYGTVSLRTKKIKGLHENDFIMAAKIDRLASTADKAA